MVPLLLILGFLCVYSYFIYPVILLMIPQRTRPRPPDEPQNDWPTVCLIITVHNEQTQIRRKLANSLAIDYPAGKLEIIVASDHSTDETDSIVKSFKSSTVRLVRSDRRLGKEYAQACAINATTAEILVFSDVATSIPKDALVTLVRYFADSTTGAVSSTDKFVSNDGQIVGEGAYVRYEMWLRNLESARGGLVGLSGSFFGARREICNSWDIESPSDFSTAINCAASGVYAVSCADVIGIYADVKESGAEYRRKWRTALRGINGLAKRVDILNPFKYGLFAFQVWSHKLMRWLVPWLMLAFGIVSVLGAKQGVTFQAAMILQLVFYSLAVLGWLVPAARQSALVRLVFFFVQSNIALAHAALSFLGGQRMTTWTPTSRSP